LSGPTPSAAPSRLAEKLPWFAVAAAALTADLWTKHLVFYPHAAEPGFDPRQGKFVADVASWWRIILAYNNGVTFGLGTGVWPWILALGVACVIVWLGRTLWRAPREERVKCFALSIIVGGAIGNLYDRALRPFVEADTHPGVRDFLDWYVPDGTALADWLHAHNVTTHWYTFNVADALIVSGVVLLAWRILREKPHESAPPEGAAA
jgi:signal peptidase II